MATKVYATPGVYIQEKDAFPSSVVAVPTAVPAFIGYTEMAKRGTKDLTNVPTRITSLAEYVELFGGAPKVQYDIHPDPNVNYVLTVDANTRYNLFYAMRFFYSNGGGPCYIVSVGGYDSSAPIEGGPLNDEENEGGLFKLLKEAEPTLVVIPDAVLLPRTECISLQQAMIAHCQKMMSRFAILDVYDYEEPAAPAAGGGGGEGGEDEDGEASAPAAAQERKPGLVREVIQNFRSINLGGKSMQWAAAYYPYLNTNIVQSSEIDFTNIKNLDALVTILTTENNALLPGDDNQERREAIQAEINKLSTTTAETSDEDISVLSNTLLAVSPTFKDVMKDISKKMNIMAPSAGIAGVYSKVDNDYGVQRAPANVGMLNVVSPTVNLSNEEQEDLNLPLSGLAVNAIRSFVGKGLLVWGARTLDGNSQDWRYINVRRSMIMIEQSIKNAAEAYVFEPNDANTWASIKSMLINFLTLQWQAGVLVGSTQDDAFTVDVGLGSTMTPTDILDGVMNITVKVAISRPAEFIVITFQQQMQKS